MPHHPGAGLTYPTFTEVEARFELLLAQGYEQTGRWTLGQIAIHLQHFFDGATGGFGKPLPGVLTALLRRTVLRRLLRTGRMPGKVPAPRRLRPPDAVESDTEALAALKASIDRFKRHQGEYHPSLAFGRLTRHEWTRLQLIHCNHHLRFLVPAKHRLAAN